MRVSKWIISVSLLLPIALFSAEPGVGATKGIVDFKRPADAVQLVGEDGHSLIPEKPKITNHWVFKDGVLTASPVWDSLVTKENYRDFRLHVEFNVNDVPNAKPEKNGNSGIYIQKRYEVQILNSFGIAEADYKNSYCGSLYRMKKPDKLVCKKAGEWQTYDIVFRSARFKDGKKVENARITVYQNNQLIHDDFSIPRKTGAGDKEGATPGPIKFQGHHNPVRFRNVWIQKLDLKLKAN